MDTTVQTVDLSKKEFKKSANISFGQAIDALNPVFVFISSLVAIITLICGAIYFVINLKVSPIEKDIAELKVEMTGLRKEVKIEIKGLREEFKTEINGLREEFKTEINGLREEIKELDLKQEERHNQLIKHLLNNKK